MAVTLAEDPSTSTKPVQKRIVVAVPMVAVRIVLTRAIIVVTKFAGNLTATAPIWIHLGRGQSIRAAFFRQGWLRRFLCSGLFQCPSFADCRPNAFFGACRQFSLWFRTDSFGRLGTFQFGPSCFLSSGHL